MKKRLLSLLLAASMVLGLCPASAFAVDTGGGIFPDEVTAQNIEEQNSSNVIRVEGGDDITLEESTGYPKQEEDTSKPWYTRSWNLYLNSGTYDFSQLSSTKCIVHFPQGSTATLVGGSCEFIEEVQVHPGLSDTPTNATIKGGTFNGIWVWGSTNNLTNLTIKDGTFNICSKSTYAISIDENDIVTLDGGTFNAPIRLRKPDHSWVPPKLIISSDSTAEFSTIENNGGIIESQKLIIYSDGYPLGSNGGTEKCSYHDSAKNDTIWEYVPDSNAAESDPKGTLYLNGSGLALTLNDSTAVNCNIVIGRTAEQTQYNVYNHDNAPSLNGGIYNGTVSGVVTINSGTFKNTVTAETDTSVISNGTFEGAVTLKQGSTIHNGTFEKAVTLEYGGSITGGTFKSTVAMPEYGKITNGTFEGAVTLNNSGSITDGTFSSVVTCNNGTITGGTFTKTSDVTINGPTISGGVFRGRLSGELYSPITGGLFLCDLQQLEHTSTGGYFRDQSTIRSANGYSYGTIYFVDEGGTFTLPKFPNEELSQISVVWENGKADSTTFTITPSQTITSVDLDTTRTGTAGDEFTLSPSDFKGQGINTAVHMTTNEFHKVNLPENISLNAVQSSGGSTLTSFASIDADRTIALPEGATIKFRDNNNTDAVFTAGSDALSKDSYGSYVYTVPGSESTVKRLNKLHIDENGLPITTGTYNEQLAGGVVTTYYGDGWTYSADGTLTITGKQTLTEETNAITTPTLIKAEVTGGTYNRARVSCSDGGKLIGAALNGSVYATGTLDNCTISLTGSDTLTLSSDASDGSVQNCKITVSGHTSDSGVSIYNNGGQIGSGNTIDLGDTTLLNDGKLLLSGDAAIKNGTIQNTNNGLLCSNGTVIEADVVNNGQIKDSVITGKVTNGATGTITDSILYGELENAPANVHKLTVTPAESVTVAPKAYDVAPAFNGTAYITEGLGITVTTSIQNPIWTAGGITLGEDQLTASTLNLTMPGSDAALSVAKKQGAFDPDDFIVTAPENAVEDGSTVYEVVAVKRPDCEKAYGKISVIYRDAEKNIVPPPNAAGVYTYTVIVADTEDFAGGTVATGSFEIALAIDPGPSPSGDDDAGTGIALVVGGAALGGAAYLIGTQIWLETNLPDGVIPTSRQQLADLLWLTAGKPEPQSSVLFTDISAEAVDSQKAARWCVEQGLLSDKGEAFKPGDYVFRPQVIKAWNDVQALQNTAQ